MRVVGVNRTRHRGIGRRYRSGGGRAAGGGRWRWWHVGGDKRKTAGGEGDEDGGSWYRGWRWRWQSQCPIALALGHGELRPTTQGSSLLCTERARERNVQGGGGARGRGPTREEA